MPSVPGLPEDGYDREPGQKSKMPPIVVGLLVAILGLLVLDMVWRKQPVVLLRDQVQQLQAQVTDLARETQALRRSVEARPVVVAGTEAKPQATIGDGRLRQGENFLAPPHNYPLLTENPGGELRQFGDKVPGSLNPLLSNSVAQSILETMVNDRLVGSDLEDLEMYRQGLATSVVITDDWQHYEIKIRPGVTWHIPPIASQEGFEWLQEPVEMTAHDFVFSLQMILDQSVDCGSIRAYYEDLAEYKAVDDYTLVMRWSKSQETNINYSINLSPLPRHIYTSNADGSAIDPERLGITFNEHWFDKAQQMAGVGPYRLVEVAIDTGYRLAVNTNYWGQPQALDSVWYDTTTEDRDVMLRAFKNGDVHAVTLTAGQYRSNIIDQGDQRFLPVHADDPMASRTGHFGWMRVSQPRWSGICWNMRQSPLNELAVRQALAHCYPVERILRDVMHGLGQPLLGPIHPTHDAYDWTIPVYEFDVTKARAVAEAGGWLDTDGDGWLDKEIDGKRRQLRVAITYSESSVTLRNLLTIYKEQAALAGIDLDLQPVEGKEWFRRLDDADFDGVTIGWQGSLALDFKQLWHSTSEAQGGGSNYAGYASDIVDQLADELRTTFEPQDRNAIGAKVQRQLYLDQPYLFMHAPESIYSWQNKGDGDGKTLGGWEYGFDKFHPLYRVNGRVRAKQRWFVE
jgi:ABC-type transport system substrate-binding protein